MTPPRLAAFALAVHVATAAAGVAGTAILFYNLVPAPDWSYDELSVLLGLINIGSGIAVAYLYAAMTQGRRAALALLAICVVLAGAAELAGTTTGFPFGHYHYTTRLGPRLFDRVPYVMPFTWFMMLVPSLELTARMRLPRAMFAPACALVFWLWDTAMDPAVTTGFAYWGWDEAGAYYGMPLRNWVGWLGTAWLIVVVYQRLAPPWRAGASRVPAVLYVAQGGFMAGLAVLVGRPGGAALWAAGLAAVAAALWARGRSRAAAADIDVSRALS